MKEIHVNDWIEFKHNDAEMGGLVTKVLDHDIIIAVAPDDRTMIPVSAVVRVNYIEVEKHQRSKPGSNSWSAIVNCTDEI